MTLCLAKASSKEVVDGICEGKQTVSSDEKRSGEYGGTAVSSLTVGASAFAGYCHWYVPGVIVHETLR